MKKLIGLILVIFLVLTTSTYATNPLPKDNQGFPIQAISSIVAIKTFSITTSSYVAITVPTEVDCKSIYVKTRSGYSWRMATSSNPVDYMLIDFNFSLALVRTEPGTIFYARSDASNDTLEVIFMD